MKLNSENKEMETCIIFLNGKRMVGVVEANEEEGYVDILNPTAIANLIKSAPTLFPIDPNDSNKEEKLEEHYTKIGEETESTLWDAIPVQRLKGEVKIINLIK